MTITPEDIRKWNSRFEKKIIDRKSHRILSESWKLAELMVAFANNINTTEEFGGRILIGISNNGIIEGFEPKEGHQGSIMNIARQNCVPAIEPEFEDVEMEDGKIVYVVTIPKMTTTPFGVKSKHGVHYKIRVGDQVIDPHPHELDALFAYGRNYGKSNSKISDLTDIDLKTDSWFTKFILKQGRNYLKKRYGDVKKPIKKEIWFFRILGVGFLVPLFATLYYSLFTKTSSFELMYFEMGLALLIAPSIFSFIVAQIAINRKCKECNSNFGIEKISSKLIYEKELFRDKNSVTTREIHRNTYRCTFCKKMNVKDEPQEKRREF